MDDDWEALAGGDLKGEDGDWEEFASDNFQKDTKESSGNWDDEVNEIPEGIKKSVPREEEEEEDWESEANWETKVPEVKDTTVPVTATAATKAPKGVQEQEEDWESDKPWVAPVKTENAFEETEENWDTPTNWEVPKTAPRNEDKTREPKVKKPKKAKGEPVLQQKGEEKEYTAEERLKLKQEGEAKAREADLLFAQDLFAGVEDEKKYAKKENNPKAMELLTTTDPKDEKEFQELAKALAKRVEEVDTEFQLNVLKEVFKSIVSSLDPDDIIEIVKVITVQLNEKTKNKPAKTVAKGKPKINVSSKKVDIEVKSKDAFGSLDGPEYDDGYDFM